jgi:hypothetical protein
MEKLGEYAESVGLKIRNCVLILIGGGWVLFCHFIIYNELHNLHASFMMSF